MDNRPRDDGQGLTGPAYSVTTILPRCLLASMCSNALPISSNENTLSIGNCSFRAFHRTPDVFPDLVEDLAHFLDRTGTEGDADIVDAARGMKVEIEIGVGAAEPADIDDAALDPGGREILARNLARDLVDDQVDAFAVVASRTCLTQPGSLESTARSAPNSFRRPRRPRIGR